MEELRELLEKYVNEGLYQIVMSKVRLDKTVTKAKVRPMLLKGELYFQLTTTVGSKELHKNYKREDVIEEILSMMERQFGQLQLESAAADGSALVSKKGKVTVKQKKRAKKQNRETCLSHNRTKQYILPVGEPVDFLVDLGVMRRDGQIVQSRYDKFRQINRFLEFIEDILPALPTDRQVTILDFGCGKSYLTFAMYYYLHIKKQYDVKIVGLDLKEDVIAHCNELCSRYGYENLKFYVGDIAGYESESPIDMVVTLHACDTATDYALYQAVRWDASVILSVPCCQHELNGQLESEVLSPIFSYGIIKERMAALMTDGLRAQLLTEQGYETQILEFIDMEHTPKNLLIRAVKTDKEKKESRDLERCMEFLHVKPTLQRLLSESNRQEAGE